MLAAGQSRRFGSNKLLWPLQEGLPMVLAAARPLLEAVPDTLAVVDDPGGEVARLLQRAGLPTVVNPRAMQGMGTSIACGVAASREARGWLIALADMPGIRAATIRRVAGRLEQGVDIAAPVCRGRRGHPVGFSASCADALLQLQGNAGARQVIASHAGKSEWIEVTDTGAITDIDTPEALQWKGPD